MDLLSIIAFCGALFIFMASPGPGTFGVIARGLGSGFKHAFSMALGMALGDLIFFLLAVFGLSAIAHILGDLFTFIKYVGGVYLLYLGIKILRSNPKKEQLKATKSVSKSTDFIAGLFICLSNPKTILFYLGFLPAFVDLRTLQSGDIILMSFLVVAILILVLGSYAYFAARAKELAKKPKTQKIMNRVAGSIMIAAGAALLAKP